jgi:hypothetical protein
VPLVLSVPTRRFNSGKREAAYGTKWTWLRRSTMFAVRGAACRNRPHAARRVTPRAALAC